jgi:hypothetical protein
VTRRPLVSPKSLNPVEVLLEAALSASRGGLVEFDLLSGLVIVLSG